MPLLQNPPVPVAQATQAAPPVPHWAAEVEVIQLMPVQQPVGQEVALQALLHPSELGGQYVPVFMQPQPQAVYEGIALQVKPAQTPLVHTAEPMPEVGPGQTTPHAPQLYGSVLVLVQVLPQTVALQVEVQAPLVQGTPLEHAVLLERTIQWMFHKSKILATRRRSAEQGSYVELVVSSSKTLVDKPRGEIIDLAVRELAEFFPIVREAKLAKATVIKEVHATFSPAPGSDAFRPSHRTSWPRLFLAGDWTATGWPATMEGAVRSGYGAAEALSGQKFLVPDLPAKGLMKLFKG